VKRDDRGKWPIIVGLRKKAAKPVACNALRGLPVFVSRALLWATEWLSGWLEFDKLWG